MLSIGEVKDPLYRWMGFNHLFKETSIINYVGVKSNFYLKISDEPEISKYVYWLQFYFL